MYKSISIILYKAKTRFQNNSLLQMPTIGNYDYIGIKSLDEIQNFTEIMSNDFLNQDFNSFHKFYATLHNETNDAKEFFEMVKKPYMFVSMLHFNYDGVKKSCDQYIKYIEIIEKELDQTNYIIYDSLDCCDIIIFFKVEKYVDGITLIQKLDSIPVVKYSYSILSFDNEIIISNEYNDDEQIDKISICGIIDDYSSFANWIKKLEMKIGGLRGSVKVKKYSRLGNEDIIINILNLSAKNFFMLYGCPREILNSQNEEYNKSLIYVRTHIDKLLDDEMGIENNQNQIEGIDLKLKKLFLDACVSAKKNNNIIFDMITNQAAIQVLNSCDYLSKNNFALDIRDCINRSVYLFIKKVESYVPKKNISGYDLVEYNESIKKYTSGIMSIVNGSLQADKMFFQVPGFNAVLYDVPSKLIVFYTAFVHDVADILNDIYSDEIFAFLVCPDLYQYTHISKLFNEENRDADLLLKVRIPVKSLFNSNRLLCELTHEVAHYVGKESRNRILRATLENNILSVEILKNIFSGIDIDVFNDVGKKNIYQTLLDYTANKLKGFVNEVKKKKALENVEYNEFGYYQTYYKELLLNAICNMLENQQDFLDGLFNKISILPNITKIKLEDFYTLKKVADRNITMLKLKYSSIIESVHELMKESYADLIMILVLGLTLEEYVLTFYNPLNSLYGNPSDTLSKSNIGERIASVLFAFDSSVQKLDFKSYPNIDNDNGKFSDFLNELKLYTYERKDIPNKKTNMLSFSSIDFNSGYLKKCKESYNMSHLEDERILRIRKIFKVLKENKILNNIEMIRNYTMKYRDNMFVENN